MNVKFEIAGKTLSLTQTVTGDINLRNECGEIFVAIEATEEGAIRCLAYPEDDEAVSTILAAPECKKC